MRSSRKFYLLHLGAGKVGTALLKQILDNRSDIKKNHGIDFIYTGIFDRDGGVFAAKGLLGSQLSLPPKPLVTNIQGCVKKIPKPFAMIDTTASDETLPLIKQTLSRGGAAVLSNKKPLAAGQNDFNGLLKAGGQRLFYETTVGAGLPVISSLKNLLSSGDEIISIKGCFSGTLGFIFSELENGNSFSTSVLKARQLGFTEPDPRDDLSGTDVARKALILARILGQRLELSDIKIEKLYPKSTGKLEVDEFLKKLTGLDKQYRQKVARAKKNGKVLRYVASVNGKSCSVGITAVDKNSDIGSLSGPDNIIIFKTKRYFDEPLVVKGPGAGVDVTAAGVFGDLLQAAKEQNHE